MANTLPPSRGLILAADGDPAYARDLRKALIDVSVDPDDVLVLLNGQAVIDFLRKGQRRPCAVLLDAWLPKWPGLDVLSWIRGQKHLRTLPVSLMSAGPDRRLLEHAVGLGANSFLLKPFGPAAIAQAMSAFAYYWRAVDLGCRTG
jgi:CheY-like chemotaxis protein